MKQKLLLFLLGILLMKGAMAQNPTWIMPPYYNNNGGSVSLLPIPPNNSANDPYDGYDGQSAKFASNIIKGLNGGILFFIVDQFIYDKDGYLIDYIENYNENISDITGTAEITVIPDPSDCNRYYIVSTHSTPGIYLKLPYVALLNMNLPNVNYPTRLGALEDWNGDKTKAITSMVPSFYAPVLAPGKHSAVFIAASKLRSDNSRFVFISNGENIFRFKITAAGFAYDNYTIPFGANDFNPYALRGEMELVETKGGYKIACPYQPYNMFIGANNVRTAVYTASLDFNGNLVAGTEYRLPLLYSNTNSIENSAYLKGVEFSSNGNILYLAHTTNTLQPNPIEYFDFNNPTAGTNGLQALNVPNAVNYQHSQIELGFNDNIYFAHAGGLAKLAASNVPNIANFTANAVAFTYAPNYETSVNNPNPAAYTSWKSYMLQDQIDGMDYNAFFLATNIPVPTITGNTNFCLGAPLTFNGSVGVANVTSYNWSLNECNVNGTIISGGYNYNSGSFNGNPGSYSFPVSPNCNKFYLVQLTVTNSCGNTKTVTKKIFIDCTAKINVGADQTICSGSCATVTMTTINYPVNVYQGHTLIGSYFTNTVQLCPGTTTSYHFVTAASGACGAASDDIVITVVQNNSDFNLSANQIAGQSYFNCSASPSITNANSVAGFGEKYIVEEIDPITEITIAGTNSSLGTNPDPACWHNYPNAITFKGYLGVQNVACNIFSSAGKFTNGKMYRITRATWNNYCPWDQTSRKVSMSGVLRSGEPVLVVEEDHSAPDYSYLKLQNQTTDNMISENMISVYPNPTSGKFNIQFNETQVQKITVYDAIGKVIIENNVEANTSNLNLDLSDIKSGIYFIKINSNENVIMKKIIKE